MKNAFEASGNSPTRGGLESIKRHIEEAFAKIRQHVPQPSTPTQAEFVYTEVHRVKFDERAKRLAHAALLRKDYLDSIKGRDVQDVQKVNAESAQDAKALAEAKEVKAIRSQINGKISNYFVGSPFGGINYASTETAQTKLRGVLAGIVGGQASDGLEKLLARVTTLKVAKDALAAVEAAFWKLQ
jgi:hypothetical protein